jgi:uncharacterized membrane protein YciS (DUF1049 family)
VTLLKRVVNWVVGLPIALIAIGFAVANRQWISISFDPFNRTHPFALIEMPLWALFFCGVFVGMLAGGLVVWLAQGKHRKAERQAKIELVRTQQQFEREKRERPTGALVTGQDSAL